MEYMSNPLIAGLVGGLITALAKMIENKMTKKEFDMKEYLKSAFFVGLVVTVIVFMATSNGSNNVVGGVEEILTEPF